MSAPAGIRRRTSASYRSISSSARPLASTRVSVDMVRRMPDVLMFADTYRSPELRHEVPIGIPDPFLYAEKDGVKHIAIGSMEIPRLAELALFELHPAEEYGSDELRRAGGLSHSEITKEVSVRAVKALGITSAVVPDSFPLWLADRLRADGVELTVDGTFFDDRRRVKTDAELAGVPRAQRAAHAGHGRTRQHPRRADPHRHTLPGYLR